MPLPMGAARASVRVRARMTQTIQWEAHAGTDNYGRAIYAPPVPVPCLIMERNRMIRTRDGAERASRATIWVPPNSGIDLDDRITLPDGSRPPLLDVQHIPFIDPVVYDVLLT